MSNSRDGMSQSALFTEGEGDRFFDRNYGEAQDMKEIPPYRAEQMANMLQRLPFTPKRLLEVGCCYGLNLEFYRQKTGGECHGVDLSKKAVEEGARLYPEISFHVADAAQLPFNDGYFDFIAFDICLYAFGPGNLFKAAAEADRVLRSGGLLVIHDFESSLPYRNTYKHNPGMFSYKFCFRDMFLWHPAYNLAEVQSLTLRGGKFVSSVNDRLSYSILYKSDLDDPGAFLTDPFGLPSP